MRRFVIVALLVLLPLVAFGVDKKEHKCDGTILCSDIPGGTCRAKCNANEVIFTKSKGTEGKLKDKIICATCKPKMVCCINKKENNPKPMPDSGGDCKSYIDASNVDGVVCKDKCLANEKIVQKIEVMDGEYKGQQVCLKCFKKGVKDSKGRPVPSGKEACSKIK